MFYHKFIVFSEFSKFLLEKYFQFIEIIIFVVGKAVEKQRMVNYFAISSFCQSHKVKVVCEQTLESEKDTKLREKGYFIVNKEKVITI